jgi:hypothetical protein
MKTFIIASLFLLSFFASNAQTVNDIPLKDIKAEYVQIVGTTRFMSLKLTININYGQEPDEESKVRDENGKKVIFNSMVDALNFMTKYGYEFVTAYALTVGNQNVYHFLLKRKKE